jgi:tetratricopeptide (TPR) repeat protein
MQPFPHALQPAFATFEAGRFAEAEQLCRAQLETAPSGELFFLLGLIANKTARHAESVRWLERAAEKLPPSLRLLSALGGTYRANHQPSQAAECFARCLELAPQSQQACQQLADACYELREYDRAATLYRRALQIEPENPALWNNLANTLRNSCELDEALAAYDRALAGRPDDARIRANRSRALLLAGRFEEGFREFEFRWQALGLRTFPQPVWRGENLPDKTLFIFAEQGHGDTIQFVRYLKMVQARVGKIMLECQPALKSLLENSHCADIVIAAGETLPSFDYYAPLLHLPSVFGTTLETVPATMPYLTPSKKIKLPETPAGNLKVGLAWSGNPEFLDDAIRSIPLTAFAEILKIPRVSFSTCN